MESESSALPDTHGNAPMDAMGLYMREIGAVPLLTLEEERALSKRMQTGDLQARDQMIRANLRWVVKIAREYLGLGMPFLDLINEGNIGLMKAVEKYRPDRGAKLSTYSAWWIRQHIRRALSSQGKTIRIPIHAADQIHRMQRIADRLREVLGRDATVEELADESGLSPRRVTRLRQAAVCVTSMDAKLGEENSVSLAERVADEQAVSPDEKLGHQETLGRLAQMVARLPERESKILRARFGLDDGQQRTLEAVGARLGLTRERIRQLQSSALKKLRWLMEQPTTSLAAA